MKKQRKQLIFLLVILLILAAAIPGVRYLTERQKEKSAEEERAEQESKILIDTAYEDLVRFSYDYEGVNYSFEKAEDTWHATDDPERNLKEDSIKNILSGVTPLYIQQTIENVTDFSQYGLDQPERTITFETASASYILHVGDYNSLTGTYYVSMPSESRVYVVEQTVITRFNRTYEDVTETAEEATEGGSTEGGSAEGESVEGMSAGSGSAEGESADVTSAEGESTEGESAEETSAEEESAGESSTDE